MEIEGRSLTASHRPHPRLYYPFEALHQSPRSPSSELYNMLHIPPDPDQNSPSLTLVPPHRNVFRTGDARATSRSQRGGSGFDRFALAPPDAEGGTAQVPLGFDMITLAPLWTLLVLGLEATNEAGLEVYTTSPAWAYNAPLYCQ